MMSAKSAGERHFDPWQSAQMLHSLAEAIIYG